MSGNRLLTLRGPMPPPRQVLMLRDSPIRPASGPGSAWVSRFGVGLQVRRGSPGSAWVSDPAETADRRSPHIRDCQYSRCACSPRKATKPAARPSRRASSPAKWVQPVGIVVAPPNLAPSGANPAGRCRSMRHWLSKGQQRACPTTGEDPRSLENSGTLRIGPTSLSQDLQGDLRSTVSAGSETRAEPGSGSGSKAPQGCPPPLPARARSATMARRTL